MRLKTALNHRLPHLLAQQLANNKPYKHAVIDVGSNSVRLVIYQVSGCSFVQIHNEKVLAGLGRGIGESGKLSPIGVELALNALKRFKLLLESLGIKSYDAIATAAARDAGDGKEFVETINKEIGLKLKIISGEEEGRLSAIGVKFGAPNAHGIMGDLGGSSLEFASMADVNNRESLHLGPLAMGNAAGSRAIAQDNAKILEKIRGELSNSLVLKQNKNLEEFHAVGGAWRNLAHINMALRNYPLQVLQNYEIARNETIELCNFVMGQSRRSIEKIPGISQRRAETLPYAAILLKEIFEQTNCRKLIISSFGLREGLIKEKLEKCMDLDPLVGSAITLVRTDKHDLEFAFSLNEWIKPISGDLIENDFKEKNEVLLTAASVLSNIGLTMHPDHRAYLAYQMVLRAPFSAINHEERVFLARIIGRRYGAKTEEIEQFECMGLLQPQLKALADLYGAAMRLGANMCSNSYSILKRTKASLQNDEIEIFLPEDLKNLYSESVRKRHDQLNAAYKHALRIAD